MPIHDEMVAELREAMKAKDRPRINVVRQIETDVSVAKAAPGYSGEADDELYLSVIKRYVKKMEKARREYEALGELGADQANKLAYEVEYLSRWLPTSLGADETKALVDAAIVELGAEDPKMTGRVIGHLMKSGVEFDGATVARLVKEALAP